MVLLPWTVIRTDRSPLLPPTSWALGGSTTDGISAAMPRALRAVGTASSTSLEMTFCWVMFWVSMSGAPPDTVTVSCMAPRSSSTFRVAVKLGGSSMPLRLSVLKPVSAKVTE